MAKEEIAKPFKLADSATHLLHRAQQEAVNMSAAELAEHNLTIRQFTVLAALHEDDGQSQSSLVETTGIDRSTLADMVSRMEKNGLVKRLSSKNDARAKSVSLTTAGEKAYKKSAPIVAFADEELVSGLRKSQRDSLMRILTYVAGDDIDIEDLKLKLKKSLKRKKKLKR